MKKHSMSRINSNNAFKASGRIFATLAIIMFTLNSSGAYANPVGGTVVAGQAAINNTSTTETITQTGGKAIINWSSFNIAPGEITQFIQPSASSTTYNRVTGVDPSKILGQLQANGKIFLVNPNGIVFGKGSRIDVNSLIASTADMTNSAFLNSNGHYNFNIPGVSGASILNHGAITAQDAGLVALVAPGVANTGIIKANLGMVVLGAGETATFDFYGDNLINFAVTGPATGAHVTNSGLISAGSVNMTARAASAVVDNVISNSGIVEASSAHEEGGQIVLDGGEGNIEVSGTLNASGQNGGGTISVKGNNVISDNTATYTADATNTGNGGTVALLANENNLFNGSISAKGGAISGNGGSAEVSGENLGFNGIVNLSAANGKLGNLLLDPNNVTIGNNSANDSALTGGPGGNGVVLNTDGGSSNYQINAATIASDLASENVSIAATKNIDVNSLIDASGAPAATSGQGNLTLNAGNNITVASAAGINLNNGTLNFQAGNNVDVKGPISIGTGTFNVTGTAGGSSAAGGTFNLTGSITAGTANIASTGKLTLNGSSAVIGSSGTFQSTGNSIEVDSALTGSGSYTFNAPTTLNGGSVGTSITPAASINFTSPVTIGANNGTLNASGTITFGSTIDGTNNLTATAGSFVLNGAIGGNTKLSALTLDSTAAGTALALPAIKAVTVQAQSGGDIDMNGAITTTGTSGDAVVLAASGNFVNTGNNPLNLHSGSNWVIYSTAPSSDNPGGLTPTTTIYGETYPSTTGVSGNTWIYSDQNAGSITLSANSQSITYGGSPSLTFADISCSGTGVCADLNGNAPIFAVSGTTSTGGFYTANTSHTISISALGTLNWNTGYTGTITYTGTGTLTVNPATLTAAGLTAGTQVYNATTVANLGGTASVTALGTDVVNLTGTAAGTMANKNVGTQGVTVSGLSLTGTDASNYILVPQSGLTATVTPADIVVSGLTAGSQVYNATTVANLGGTASVTPLLTDVVSLTGTAAGTLASKNVGTQGVTVSGLSLTGTDASNYNLVEQSGLTANVTPAALTITALTNTKTYDSTTSAAAAPIVSGLQGTDTVTGLSETYASKNAGTGLTLTPTGTVNDGNGGNNYTTTFTPVTTGVINPEAVTITATTNTKTYDGTASASAAPTITSGTIFSGDTGSFTETYANKNAGTGLALTPTGSINDGNSGGNYTVTFAPVTTGVINQEAITVAAAPNTKTYDGTASASVTPSVISGTIMTGDTANFSETYANKNAGTGLTLTPSGSVSDGNAGGNYAVTFAPVATGIINQEAITVSALTNTKTYDGTTSASVTPTITSGTIMSGDTANFSETYASKNAGTGLTLTPSGSVSDGNSGGNYAVTFAPVATGVINQEAVTVTAHSNTKTYDGTTSSATLATLTSGTIMTGDSVTWTEVYTNKNAGNNKTLTANGDVVNDGNGGGNYNVTFINNTHGTINQENITVTAQANTKTYDGTTSSATLATLTSGTIMTGDSVTWTEVYTNKNAGNNKTLTANNDTVSDGNGGNNYNVTFINNNHGTVNKEDITVTAATNTKTYNGTTSASATPTITSGTIMTGDTANFSETYANKNAGTGLTLTPSGAVNDGNGGNNYTVTFVHNTTGVINQEAITVTAAANTRTYNGTTSANATPTITSGSIMTGDNANFSETYASKNAGTGLTLTPSGAVNDGNGGNNYIVTFTNNTHGIINPEAITVTAQANTKTYDSTTSANATPTVTSGTIFSGDTANFTETYANKNAGNNLTLTPSGSVNDGNGGSNYTVTFVHNTHGTINQATLTVSGLTANNKTYDGTNTASINNGSDTLVGVIGSDSVSLNTTNNATFSQSNVGNNLTVTASGFSLSGTDRNNYTLTQPTTRANITAATLTVTANNATKVYGTVNPTLTDTITGYVDGQNANSAGIHGSATLSTTATQFSSVTGGPYTITAAAGNLSSNHNNYVFQYVNAPTGLTITAAPITVTASSGQTVVYGSNIGTLTYTVTSGSLVNSDTLSGTLTTAQGGAGTAATHTNNLDVGNYAITQGTLANSNYNITYVGANLTVTPLAITVASGVTANDKNYDGTTTATLSFNSPTLAGTVIGDTVSVNQNSAYSANFSDPVVANNKAVTVTSLGLTGAQASDYSLTQPTGLTANINAVPTPGPVTIFPTLSGGTGPIVPPAPPSNPGGNNTGNGNGGGGTNTGSNTINGLLNQFNNVDLGSPNDHNDAFSGAGITTIGNIPDHGGQQFSFGTGQNLSLLGSGGGNNTRGNPNFSNLTPGQLGALNPQAGGQANGGTNENCANNALGDLHANAGGCQ